MSRLARSDRRCRRRRRFRTHPHIAHALKGAAGNLSAHALTALAGRLEAMGREGNLTACAACAELSAECDRLLGTLRQQRVH